MTRDGGGPQLHEVVASWLLLAVVAAMVWVTYARLPASDFYNVSGTGFGAGAARVLVLVGWPVSIAAIALTAVAADRLLGTVAPRRAVLVAAVASVILCATIAWPGVITQANLDAKASNGIAAAGVALSVGLTLWVIRAAGMGRPAGRLPGDAASIAFVVLLAAAAVPWILANAGIYAGDVPGLGRIYMSTQILPEPGHPHLRAVHLGNHEGLDGCLLAAISLALRRALPRMRPTRLRPVVGGYLAVMLAYGVMVAANDGWHEQVVKRGWTGRMLPSVITPGVTVGWGILLVAAAVLYLAAFRVRGRAPEPPV
jgi:hypothetical protein